MKKYTINEINNKLQAHGFQLIGEYINSHTKTKIRCHCGKIFNGKPNHILTKSTKTCGRCNEPAINIKFNSLTIVEVRHGSGSGCSVKCICDCGNEVGWRCFHKIETGHTSSCGHCNDPKVGDKFGRLTVIEVMPSKTSGCSVKCVCDCGRHKTYRAYRIVSKQISSCGNCKLTRNGITTSKTAIKLHILIEKILNKQCIHNKKIEHYYIDIVQSELKIAVEYDSYYYHRVHHQTQQKEIKINNMLKKMEYKFLRIRSDGYDIPSEKQLRKVLLVDFQKGENKKTITLQSWKTAMIKRQQKEQQH